MEKANAFTRKGFDASADLKANMSRDVIVRIGFKGTKKDGNQKFTVQKFNDFLQPLLDVARSSEKLSTQDKSGGDILLDQPHRNVIYQMGIKLHVGYNIRGYQFGYNFWNGRTEKARARLLDDAGDGDDMPDSFIHELFGKFILQ